MHRTQIVALTAGINESEIRKNNAICCFFFHVKYVWTKAISRNLPVFLSNSFFWTEKTVHLDFYARNIDRPINSHVHLLKKKNERIEKNLAACIVLFMYMIKGWSSSINPETSLISDQKWLNQYAKPFHAILNNHHIMMDWKSVILSLYNSILLHTHILWSIVLLIYDCLRPVVVHFYRLIDN